MKLRTSFFELDLPSGCEKISLTEPTGTNEDAIVLKLRNLGMVTIEAVYMSNTKEPFSQIRDSLAHDAKSISATITEENADASEFSMESILENEPFVHHHFLIQRNDFVFDGNLFKNFNPEDLTDVKSMMNSIVLFENSNETPSFSAGERMPMRHVQLTD
jgi:hypothetical protein